MADEKKDDKPADIKPSAPKMPEPKPLDPKPVVVTNPPASLTVDIPAHMDGDAHAADKTVPRGAYIVRRGNQFVVVDCDGIQRKDKRVAIVDGKPEVQDA